MRAEARAVGPKWERMRGALGLAERPLLPSVAVGLMVSLLVFFNAVSYPSLIFAGALDAHAATGIGMALFSAVVLSTALALASSCEGAVGIGQSETAVVLGVIAATLVESGRLAPEAVLPTVAMAIALAALALGALMILLGALDLGNLVRYIPYPVIGGFLAGIGWLLTLGALRNALGVPVRPETLGTFLEPDRALVWVPAVVLAVLIFTLQQRRPHVLNLPLALLGALAVFWLLALLAGAGPGELAARRLTMGAAGGALAWLPLGHLADPSLIDWRALLGLAPQFASLLVIGLVTLLLNASSIELVTRRDFDLNRELKVTGGANLVLGVAGGLPGYHSLSGSILSHQLGAPVRLVGLISAAVCLAGLALGPALLAALPRFVVCAVLLFVAFNLLASWLWRTRAQLPLPEYLVLALVFVSVAFVGIMQGVAIGVVTGVILFVVNYSRVSVIREAGSLAALRSNVERPEAMRAILARHGEEAYVLRLQGYIFFGTASRLTAHIRSRLEDGPGQRLRCLALDFERVAGLDSSALASFAKLAQYAEQWGFELVFCGLPPPIAAALAQAGLAEGGHARVRIRPDLDHALETCEDVVLTAHDVEPERFTAPLETWLGEVLTPAQAHAFLAYVERLTSAPGEVLIAQDDRSEELFFIEAGRVSVHFATADGHRLRLRAMGPGTIVGEVAFYCGLPRSASVVADAETIAWRLDHAGLERLRQDDPALAERFHLFMARLMAARLRDANRLIEAAAH